MRHGIIASARIPSSIPASIPNLEAWYDFSDLATLTLVSSTHISGVADKSGNGFNGYQGTDASRPILTADLIKAGLNAANFAGTYMFTIAGVANTKPTSIFAAVKLTATASYRSVFGANQGGGIEYRVSNVHKHSLVKNQVVEIGVGTNAIPTGVTTILGMTYSAAGVYSFYNGNVANGTGTNNQTFTSVDNAGILGDSIAEPWGGPIGEIIKYSRDIDSTERTTLYNYLVAKWV